jgi:hypothetical protein
VAGMISPPNPPFGGLLSIINGKYQNKEFVSLNKNIK